MKSAGCVTNADHSVTQQRDTLARARPPTGGCHDVTRDTSCRDKRDVTGGERDMSACRPHVTPAAPSIAKRPMTWLHIAALNLIADHDAGIAVDPVRLAAARSFIAKDARQ